MDPVYGTKRRAVPLLVEDVNQGETSVDVKSINSKMDDLATKIGELQNVVKSNVPMGCYTHWRWEFSSSTAKGTLNPMSSTPQITSSAIGAYIVFDCSSTAVMVLKKARPSSPNSVTATYNYFAPAPARYDVGHLFIYNENDPAVVPFEVMTTSKSCPAPPYYPLNTVGYTSHTGLFNVPSAKEFHDVMGTTSSAETTNTVIGLLKSISNKLSRFY